MGPTTVREQAILLFVTALVMSISSADGQCLTVDKATLNIKTYAFGAILQASNLPTLPGMPFALKGIRLKHVGSKIVFFDARIGQGPLNIAEPEPIVGDFPVTNETDSQVTFDLSRGNWSFTISLGRVAVSTTNILSYVDEFDNQDGAISFSLNTAHITSEFFKDSNGEETNELYLMLRFFLRDYATDPTFEKRLNIPKKVGYFQTGPAFIPTANTSTMVISRRNLSKQIVYYLSPTIPRPYCQAIKEGIQEWNKVLGEDRIVVLDGNDAIHFYDARYNVIYWIDDPKYAPAVAYGPSLAMPDSGEIIDGDVILCGGSFLVSAIGYYRQRMAAYQQQLAQLGLIPVTSNAPRFDILSQYLQYIDVISDKEIIPIGISMNGWIATNEIMEDISKDGIDRIDLEAIFQDDAPGNAPGNTPVDAPVPSVPVQLPPHPFDGMSLEQYLMAEIKSTVMHEVGHTLGLRHNFKGSMGENEQLPSSSVMDYMHPSVSFKMSRLGEYDIAAIKYGYFGDMGIATMNLLFATDEDIAIDPDCRQFDRGKDPLDYYLNTFNKIIEKTLGPVNGRAGIGKDILLFYVTKLVDCLTPVILSGRQRKAFAPLAGVLKKQDLILPQMDEPVLSNYKLYIYTALIGHPKEIWSSFGHGKILTRDQEIMKELGMESLRIGLDTAEKERFQTRGKVIEFFKSLQDRNGLVLLYYLKKQITKKVEIFQAELDAPELSDVQRDAIMTKLSFEEQLLGAAERLLSPYFNL